MPVHGPEVGVQSCRGMEPARIARVPVEVGEAPAHPASLDLELGGKGGGGIRDAPRAVRAALPAPGIVDGERA